MTRYIIELDGGITPENFNPASVADRAGLMAAFKRAAPAAEINGPGFWKIGGRIAINGKPVRIYAVGVKK